MVKQAGVAAWLIGIAAVIAVTTWSGLDAVGHAVASVGWGILFVVVVRGVTVAVAGAGWWLIFPSQTRPQLRTCVLLRFIREATNVLLPMAQVGGDLIGAGLLTLYAVPGALAAASVIVDVLLQAATQFAFAIVGLLVLIALGADATLAWVAAIGLGLGGLLLAGFYLAQRRGGQRILHAAVSRLTGDAKVARARHDRCRLSKPGHDLRGPVRPRRQHRRAYGRLDHRRCRGPDRVRVHGQSDQRRRGAGDRKSPACHSRSGVCHSRRARGAGRRPGAAVRRIRNSAGTGDRAIAGQAGGRSRARRARPCRLADAGMGTPHAELFPGRAATADSPSILVRSEP